MKRRYLAIIIGLCALMMAPMGGCSPAGAGAYSISGSSYLVNGTITVNAGSYYDEQFTVTRAMKKPALTGSFTASGGPGNDVIALIIDDKDFSHWINGYEVNTIYNSGRLTTASINLSLLTPGTYHFVLSNRISLLSVKEVSASVVFQWSQ